MSLTKVNRDMIGDINLANTTEATTGTDVLKLMTPKTTADAIAASTPPTVVLPTVTLSKMAMIGNDQTTPELITSMNITTGSPYTFYRVMQVAVTNVKAGDILECYSDMQVTTTHSYNLMFATFLNVQTSPAHSVTTFVEEITERNGQNFDLNVHHFNRSRQGVFVPTIDYAVLYFNLWAYTASSAAGGGDTLGVDQDYGRIYVKHHYDEDVDLNTL